MAGTESEAATMEDPGQEGEGEEDGRAGHRLPLARVKRIMKADPDLQLTSQDAVFLIAKATELFVESLVQEAYQFTLKGRKKTVTRRDVDNCIEAIDALAFLDGALDWS
ncbi:DNA polymerase epsilon subunit 4 [Chionoecetes opilio]|uniref:DNA polymerase epsilon subunit 4 n=1 Tax=Chionoecetes opilio TaxID=41210 RepID=A0A8J4XSW7_CHIOP|nr:DNA polymerase epsilon subunit 4 [Chionoecetes opilio]